MLSAQWSLLIALGTAATAGAGRVRLAGLRRPRLRVICRWIPGLARNHIPEVLNGWPFSGGVGPGERRPRVGDVPREVNDRRILEDPPGKRISAGFESKFSDITEISRLRSILCDRVLNWLQPRRRRLVWARGPRSERIARPDQRRAPACGDERRLPALQSLATGRPPTGGILDRHGQRVCPGQRPANRVGPVCVARPAA